MNKETVHKWKVSPKDLPYPMAIGSSSRKMRKCRICGKQGNLVFDMFIGHCHQKCLDGRIIIHKDSMGASFD